MNGRPLTVVQIQCTRQIETDTVQFGGSCILSDTVQSSGFQPCASFAVYIANLEKMAVTETREAEPTTGRRNEVGLAVRQATIELLAESGRQ